MKQTTLICEDDSGQEPSISPRLPFWIQLRFWVIGKMVLLVSTSVLPLIPQPFHAASCRISYRELEITESDSRNGWWNPRRRREKVRL